MFKLLRYFSVTSLSAFIVVAVLLGAFYRQLLLNNLIDIAESKNVALTQAFSNSLWPQFAPFVASASQLSRDELQAHPETAKLHQAVLAQMKRLSVVKVKVYDLDGLTVFSTEFDQIGDDKSQNQGFLSARAGQIASELTHRETFSAFEGTIEDRDVFSSYIPIQQAGAASPIEAVFEVYDDVTPLMQRLERAQRNIIMGLTFILTALYVSLYLIVKRADQVIKRQYRERQLAEAALQQHKAHLEAVVAARTAELSTTNMALRAEISERQRVAEELLLARDQALEANRLKSELLAKVSHELRTPIGVILGYMDLIGEKVYGPLTPKQAGAIAKVIDSSHYLTHLVSELLNQAQLEAGKLKLHIRSFEPLEIIEPIRSKMTVLAKAKGLQLTFNIAPDLPATLSGDPDRLQQVLLNLVGNSIKFTETGGVQIDLRCADPTHWALIVSDTGPGIPKEAQVDIFEPFGQVDSSNTRKHAGTGLGLSIVKQMTQLMAGQVSLESEIERGSTFIVTFPLKPQKKQSA